ncbi:MAG TPA: hypothetical protein VKU01_15710 [Bryobacteraceae bacterium]|nr:hypothetical protein [Bryobacteraceae bacterium]
MKNTMNHYVQLRGQNMLPRLWKTALGTFLCAAACSQLALAQVAAPSILQIDVANNVIYLEDTSDVSKFATDPKATAVIGHGATNFNRGFGVADIVAVNGEPVTGTHIRSAQNFSSSTAPTPGGAITDTVRVAVAVFTFEILKGDGTPIGTIVATGLAGGPAPPGSPLIATGGSDFAITGGTGAFLGARGQMEIAANPPGVVNQRPASITEDPANRRLNGGGKQRYVVHLIPMSAPQILTTGAGPAVTHSSDFSLVTSSNPAAAGEILSVFVSGLGPTVPAVDPAQPFPSSPPANVNSPIDVIVNGEAAEVLGAVGYPGAVDGYQVNFRVPPDAAKGLATMQVSAAWINGTAVQIAVQ